MLTLSEMPQNYQFIDNLIELRAHYQSLTEDSERSSSHVIEQLNHINALLVDQLLENQQFVESLLQLREHYQTLHSQYQQKAVRAREQIAHVNALLADQVVLQHKEHQPISIQAAALEQQALFGVSADNSEESLQQEPESVQQPEPLEASEQQLAKDISRREQDRAIAPDSGESSQQNLEVGAVEESTEILGQQLAKDAIPSEQDAEKTGLQEPELPVAVEQQLPTDSSQVEQQSEPEPPTESPDVEDFPERPQGGEPAELASRYSPLLRTPLLPQYQHLKKSEAVEKLMQENAGSILHVDYIIRALYGELDPEDVKAEKPRMNDSLKKGVAKGLWDKVPDSPGCYTADLKLVESKTKAKKAEGNKRQARKPNPKVTEGMLPRYQNLSFTEAVETVVRDRSGEVLTPDVVARALYGELEGEAFTQAKTKVGKTLWSGANQGRWQSVIGKLGAYTLDLKLVNS
jgi:hypothetical protein